MIPITWLSCLAALWIIVVDTQVNTTDPLVLAAYSPKYNNRRITFLDLTDVNDDNLKLPLDAAEPRYFVLFCAKAGNADYTYLIIQRVTEKIDSEAKKVKCENHPLPCTEKPSPPSSSIYGRTGYKISRELSKQENEITTTSKLLTQFRKEFWLDINPVYFEVYLDKIEYNYEHNIPLLLRHKVKAHMHSKTYEDICGEIRFNTSNVESEAQSSTTLPSIQVPDYRWRQLVPMQDFKGTYATKVTCTYLNYLWLHKDAIESLERIENFIREVADVINEVDVQSGTYTSDEDVHAQSKTYTVDEDVHVETVTHTPEENVSLKGNEPNQTIIPSIVWKKITHRGSSTNYYSVVIVIHNRKTERICEHNKNIEKLGLPEYDYRKKEIDIGDMYYCLTNDKITKLLDYYPNNDEEPLNLNNLPFEINVKEIIKKKTAG